MIVGIDPGLSGAVAILRPSYGNGANVFSTPTLTAKGKKQYAIAEMVRLLSKCSRVEGVIVILEDVHAMPGQGVTSMFSFGRGVGLWEGILAALQIPYQKVTPQVWKAAMGLRGKDKGASILLAQQRFPQLAATIGRNDGRAEALLMALYWSEKGEKNAGDGAKEPGKYSYQYREIPDSGR